MDEHHLQAGAGERHQVVRHGLRHDVGSGTSAVQGLLRRLRQKVRPRARRLQAARPRAGQVQISAWTRAEGVVDLLIGHHWPSLLLLRLLLLQYYYYYYYYYSEYYYMFDATIDLAK